jgi:hypothetical protein
MDTTGTCSDDYWDDDPAECEANGQSYTYAYCNFDPLATEDDGSCTVPDVCDFCAAEFQVTYDATLFDGLGGYEWYNAETDEYTYSCNCAGARWDACGVCAGDDTTCHGCQDAAACNYDNTAAGDPCKGCCINPDQCGDCDYTSECTGTDGVGDGCGIQGDGSACAGCIDASACDYDPSATYDPLENNGSCDYSCIGCMDDDPNTNGGVASNYDANATIPCSDCCSYAWTCEETLVEAEVYPQCHTDTTTIVTNANGIPDWGGPAPSIGWADYLSQYYGDDTTDDFAYCTPLPFGGAGSGNWPGPFFWDDDCADCEEDATPTGDALKAGIVYSLQYYSTQTGAAGIMTGDKGPANWDGYTSLNCSFDDLFTQANYDNNEDLYNSVGIYQAGMDDLVTHATSQGANNNFSVMQLFVSNMHLGGTLSLKWSAFSCCCASGTAAIYEYECVIDPGGTFSTQVACQASGDCDISGTPAISGCTDSTAANYNSNAQTDDGSCIYTWGCQPGVELTNNCSRLVDVSINFNNNAAILDYFSDSANTAQHVNIGLYKASVLNSVSGKNECVSESGYIYHALNNFTVTNSGKVVFVGLRWADVITFLIKNKITVTNSMTRAQVINTISASSKANYVINLVTTQCFCTHGPCFCEADTNGTHATEKACKNDKANCCT